MKKNLLLTLLSFVIVTMSFSQKLYGVVAYHKVAPGHTIDEAIAIEKEWKVLHQVRKDAGIISNWAVFTNYGSLVTKDVDFDYITVNYGTDVDKVGTYPTALWQDFVKTHPSYSDLSARTAKVTNIVRQNLLVNEAMVGAFKPDQIFVFEFMKVSAANYYTYLDFEKKMAKVQEERMNAGFISRWSFWRQMLPSAYQGHFAFSTVTAFPNFASYEKGGYSDAMAKKHYGLSLNDMYKKAVGLRDIETSWVATVADRL